eukprot:m.333485 g.333485  ORF g.333485 m.333485 type:complete len:646 (-) comp17154_c0_seq1:2212-4149(-)
MKLTCLSEDPLAPCYLLKLEQTCILFDCPLVMTPVLHFLPLQLIQGSQYANMSAWDGAAKQGSDFHTVKFHAGRVLLEEPIEYRIPRLELVDMETVDAIVISNFHSMLALPYFTERTKFKGEIYATEPTIQFGAHMMRSLVAHSTRAHRPSSANFKTENILSALTGDANDALSWVELYSLDEVDAALGRCSPISYNQKIALQRDIILSAHASGFAIGSCNWIVNMASSRFAYVTASSAASARHPMPLDTKAMRHSDVLVLAGLTRWPKRKPDDSIREMLSLIVWTLRNKGNVLIPCYCTGIVHDLVEIIVEHLRQAKVRDTPVFFLSPSSRHSLEYSNICSNWLCSSKSDKVMLPEWPFGHHSMMQNGTLSPHACVDSAFMKNYREPCILLADQPSMRSGDSAYFMQKWCKSQNNTLIVVEPDLDFNSLIAPYQPIEMKTLHIPIDPRLNFEEANDFLADVNPAVLVTSEVYFNARERSHESEYGGRSKEISRTNQIVFAGNQIVATEIGDLEFPQDIKFESAGVAPKVMGGLQTTDVAAGVSAVSLQANIHSLNYEYELDSFQQQKDSVFLYGSLKTQRLVEILSSYGLRNLKITQNSGTDTIELGSLGARVHLSGDNTVIECNDNSTLRLTLRDAVVSLLTEV